MSVDRTRRLSARLLAVPMLCAGAGVGLAQSSDDANIFDRARKGDITESFHAQIKAGPAKNVLLVIGDGMG